MQKKSYFWCFFLLRSFFFRTFACKIRSIMSELVKRTLSGAVFVACMVGCILWNPYAYCGLFLLIGVLAVDEFHRLVQSPRALRIYAFILTVTLFVMMDSLSWRMDFVQTNYRALGIILAVAYLLLIIFAVMDEIWNHSERPLQSWGNLFVSQMMIGLPLAATAFLYFLDKWLLLALFVLIWTNDTGAYCVGSLTAKRKNGNHKMAPHISPKKSWEGLVGGFVFAMAGAFLLWHFGWFDTIIVEGRGMVTTAIFAFLVSTFGTMGDLMESLMKRSVGVKDSGTFLPGHGGVLDRFDSVLLAGPIITSFCWLCYYIVPLF